MSKPLPLTLDYIKERIKVDANGCWIWQQGRKRFGHGCVRRNNKTLLVHRVIMQLLGHQLTSNDCVCHKCDVPPCCNPDHLFIGTQKDNMRDAASKGRCRGGNLRGEKCGASKITEADVKLILLFSAAGYMEKEIQLHVPKMSKSGIGRIIRRETWKHVTI